VAVKANWADIEALVGHLFEQGFAPERQDLIDLAFAKDASDDVVDALDTLSSRPVASLESLRELLEKNGVLA
jgi:hypothetical protein